MCVMPLVFSYGTLQKESVQLATFGRLLVGSSDALPGYSETRVPIVDPAQRAATGLTHYANAEHNGDYNNQVKGTAFELSAAELAIADGYEQIADYARIEVTLVSGQRAWVYVHRPGALAGRGQ